MQRSDVLEVLKRVEPALSAKDLIPVYTCFCFEEKRVVTYDDVVAMAHPLELGIIGAIRGRVLLDFLAASRAKDLLIELAESGKDAVVKTGRSRITVPVTPRKDFLFKFPKLDGGVGDAPPENFFPALGRAMVGMGTDPNHPWRLGVTVTFGEEGKVTLFSCDNKTVTRVTCQWDSPWKGTTVILPPRFCELATAAAAKNTVQNMTVKDGWVACSFAGGLEMLTKTVPNVDLKMYRSILKSVVDAGALQTTIPIPAGLGRCLERASVVLPFSKEPYTRAMVAEGKLVLNTKSPQGNVRDAVTLDGHEDADVWFAPDLLSRVMPHAEAFCISPAAKCVAVASKNFVHLITTVDGVKG